jgi:hypothetical protein
MVRCRSAPVPSLPLTEDRRDQSWHTGLAWIASKSLSEYGPSLPPSIRVRNVTMASAW